MGLRLINTKSELNKMELEKAMNQNYPLPSIGQFDRINAPKMASSYQRKINQLQKTRDELIRVVLKRKKQASFDHELIYSLRKEVGDERFYQLVAFCKKTKTLRVTTEEQAYGNCLKCKQFGGLVGYTTQLCRSCMLKTGWKVIGDGVWGK